MRVTCPVCETSYTHERLGLVLTERVAQVTVVCTCCGTAFDVQVEPTPPTIERTETPAPWFMRVVMRRGPTVTEVTKAPEQSHMVTVAQPREE